MVKWWWIILVVGLVAVPPAFADVAIADFETSAEIATSENVRTQRVKADSPQGESHLRVTVKLDGLNPGWIRFPLAAGDSFVGSAGLTAQVRVTGTVESTVLRWLALDERGQPIFQRRFDLAPGQKWVRLDEPLRNWRWFDRSAGSWGEVRELALRIETPADAVEVDDIRLIGTATAAERTDWILRLAFGQKQTRRVEAAGMLVATDAFDAFSDADLNALLDNMARARTWVKRVFGDAVRPIDGEGPLMMLIFLKDEDRKGFFNRLGAQWRATLTPPQAQGFTVQDICSSTYDPALGPRRPVYLHEAVHGVVARELRLPSGLALTSPLQEGIANYVQLCVYPGSLSRATYVTNFNRLIDRSGKGFFRPLSMLFEDRASAEVYAQLASLVAYLVERDPSLLKAMAKGMAIGLSAEQVLADRQMDWETLEKSWMEWGKSRFGSNSGDSTKIFDPLIEFK